LQQALQLVGVAGQSRLEQGQSPEQRLREVTTIGAPAEVVMRLDLDEDAQVVVRRRILRFSQ